MIVVQALWTGTSSVELLTIWWDYKGVMYFEMLPSNQAINLDVYNQQLMKLEEAITIEKAVIVLHHENARPQISLETNDEIRNVASSI